MQVEMSFVNEKIEVAREYVEMVEEVGYHEQLDNAWNILSLAEKEDWEAIQNAPLDY